MATTIVQDLRVQPLKVKLNTSGLTASDGYWVTPGTPLKITGDEQMGLAGDGDLVDAYAQIAMDTDRYPTLADVARFRLPVITKYNYLARVVVGENVSAGNDLASMGAAGVKKITGAQIEAGVNPTGKVFAGALSTKEAQVLI